jgi:hypothetical protein
MIDFDETFATGFECEQLEELPGSDRSRYYYGENAGIGADGLLVSVRPRISAPWIGVFALGKVTPKAKSGLYSWPHPETLCVVSRGQAYLVNVEQPTKFEIVNVHPVLDVIPVASKRIVVFANYTELAAYGESGRVWVSQRLSWDGFSVTAVTSEYIEGRAWEPSVEAEVDFRINLSDGRRAGDEH